MKNRFTFSIFTLSVLFTLSFSSSVFAATTNLAIPSKPNKQQVAPVANVNIQNVDLISQKGNTFDISFDISNGKISQSGVKYGVKLVSKTKTGQVLVDEKVYDETLALPENSVMSKTITYVAPSNLSGPYSIVLFSSNTSGFPFAIAFVKDITLTASTKGFEIIGSSCYLSVDGDTNKTHYGLLQVIDIAPNEMLRLTCNTVNHTNESLSLTPIYETRYTSVYGDIASTTGGDVMPIKFAPSKNENFSLVLPKGVTSQVYNINVTLKNGSMVSNTVILKYLIRGVHATISNVTLDKDYYQAGDTATFSVIWSSSASSDKLIRGIGGTTTPNLTFSATLTNDKGNKCAEITNEQLVRGTSGPQAQVSAKIMSTCFNPKVTAVIKDDAGNTLDQKDFDTITTSTVPPAQTTPNSNFLIAIVALLAVVIIVGIIIKMRNNNSRITSNK